MADDDDDTIPRLKALVGEHGFAQLEAFAEALSKSPPTEEQYQRAFDRLKASSRAMGVTDADIAAIKEELFGSEDTG
jgi:hypothetical protein